MLELLLALALTVMVAAAMAAALYTAFRARARAEAVVMRTRAQDAAIAELAGDLACAVPPSTQPTSLVPTFEGTDTDLQFYCTGAGPLNMAGTDSGSAAGQMGSPGGLPRHVQTGLPGSAPAIVQGGIRFVELTVDQAEGSDEGVFTRRVTNNLLRPNPPDPTPEVICRHVLQLRFRYFDGESWYDTWDSTQQQNVLPVAVEALLVLAPSEPGGPPVTVDRMLPVPCGVSIDVLNQSSTGGQTP